MADKETSFPLRENLSDLLEDIARQRGMTPEELGGELVREELKRRLPFSPKKGTVLQIRRGP